MVKKIIIFGFKAVFILICTLEEQKKYIETLISIFPKLINWIDILPSLMKEGVLHAD